MNEQGKSKRSLPTDRLAVEKQVELLRAFAAVYQVSGKPVTNEQAGNAVTPQKASATVLLTNPFFKDTGLIVPHESGGFIPSQELVDYSKALQWDEEEAKQKLRPIFERTWFYKCLVPRLQLAPQPRKSCIAVLANESGANPDYEERLQNVLRFLVVFGLISITGDTVSLIQLGRLPSKVTTVQDLTTQSAPATLAQLPIKRIDDAAGAHTYELLLDKEGKRKITVTAPLDITHKEVRRISKWLEFQLLTEEIEEFLKE